MGSTPFQNDRDGGTKRTMRTRTPLADLPARLKNKIQIEPESAGERHACWIWTGSFQAARLRHRHYRQAESRESYTDKTAYRSRERPTPNIRSPELGYAVPAYREVFAAVTGVSIRAIPPLKRCDNDACVSPYHCNARPRPRKSMEKIEAAEATITREEAMAALKRANPPAFATREDGATDAGLPLSAVPEDLWDEYCEWEQRENSDLYA